MWRHRPAHLKPRHFHAEPELNVVFAGKARLGLGRDEVELCAGEFVYFAPGQDHVLLEASPDLDLFVFALRPDLAERGLGSCVLRSSRGEVLDSLVKEEWLEALVHLEQTRDAGAVEEHVVRLFSQAASFLQPGHATSRRALSQLLSHPELTTSELAACIGASRSEMSRRVHRDWGVSLVELRSRSRLMRFVDAIEAGEDLSAAAFAADFGSYARCYHAFRRAFDCSPQQYLRARRSMGSSDPSA